MKKLNANPPPSVRRGSQLTLHRESRGGRAAVHVTVDHIEDGQIWVKGSSCALNEGDTVIIEYRAEEDARYFADGEVGAQAPDCTTVSFNGEWRRIQDRSFVRISTHGLEVKVPARPTASTKRRANTRQSEDGWDRFEMLDMSAGGIRFESGVPFEFDDTFVCHFELPGHLCYVLPVRVVRSQRRPGYRNRYLIAVEFLDLDEQHRAELLQWTFREQARRRRIERRTS
ncbi:MAG: PilZ domain-containing protein [bacterium]|nr:PilZ domain-containing protein [bacterium]